MPAIRRPRIPKLLLLHVADDELVDDVLDARGLLRELDGLVDLLLALYVIAREVDDSTARVDVDLQASDLRIGEKLRLDRRRDRHVVYDLADRTVGLGVRRVSADRRVALAARSGRGASGRRAAAHGGVLTR